MKVSRKLTICAVGAGLMLAGTAQAATVGFTSGEGYADGALNAHPDWVTSAGGVVENAGTTGDVYLDGYERCGYVTNEADVATYNVFTTSIDFSFNDDTNNTAWKSILNVGAYGWPTNVDNAPKIVANIRRQGSQKKYSIRIDGTGWDVQLGSTSGTASEADIGLDTPNGDDVTDLLRMTAELSRGSTGSNWTINAKLYNLGNDPGATTPLIDYTEYNLVHTQLFDAVSIYGGFGGGQSDSNAGLTNRYVHTFEYNATYVAPPAPPAPTIVQWGEVGGDGNIVTNGSKNFVPYPAYTTYGDNRACNPEIGTNYYADATDRSPVFNHAGSNGSNSKSVTEDGAGDFIASAKNQLAYRKIVTWENFLVDNHTVDTLAVETRRSANKGDDYSYFRWIIKKGTGVWYASDEVATSAGWTLYEEDAPENINWYSFNPYQFIDDVTFATNASMITMDDVEVVGLFGSFTNSDGGYCALQTRYFEATANPGTTSDTLLQWGDVGGDTNIVSAKQQFVDRGTGNIETYTAGETSSPPVSVDYYLNNTGRSPVINAACNKRWANTIGINDGDDAILYAHNEANLEAMFVWENWVNDPTEVQAFSMECRRSGAGSSNVVVRFLVEDSTSAWFASEPIEVTAKDSWTGVIAATADVDWYDFTPMANKAVVFGAAATPDMQDIVSAGFYVQAQGSGAWNEFKTRMFRVAGTTGAPLAGYDEWALLNGVTGGQTDDDDGDNLNNYGEYVFGGDPTPPNGHLDQGTQPDFEAATGIYNFSLIGDNSVVAHVVVSPSLVNPTWTTNATVNVAVTDGVLSNYTSTVGTSLSEEFIKLLVE